MRKPFMDDAYYGKFMTVLILITISFLSCLWFQTCKRRFLLKTRKLTLDWKQARQKRIRWRQEYPWAPFDNLEYAILWEREIFCEELLIECNSIGYRMSYRDYLEERDRWQRGHEARDQDERPGD